MEKAVRPRATAADVLGRDAAPVDERWQWHHDRLVEMRAYLSERREESVRNGQSERTDFRLSLGDKGTDEYDMGAAFSLVSSEQDAIYEVEQAMRRIRDGTYGVCEATGKPIEEERLRAIPWTRFAKDVEENLEREQQAKKPRHVF